MLTLRPGMPGRPGLPGRPGTSTSLVPSLCLTLSSRLPLLLASPHGLCLPLRHGTCPELPCGPGALFAPHPCSGWQGVGPGDDTGDVHYTPGGSDGKASRRNAGDLGSIPGSERPPGGGKGNPLQCSCLENPVDRGAWWATVHGVARSQTGLKRLRTHTQDIQRLGRKQRLKDRRRGAARKSSPRPR